MPRLRPDNTPPRPLIEVECGCGRPVYAVVDGTPVCFDHWTDDANRRAFDRVFYDRTPTPATTLVEALEALLARVRVEP
jgi:hypothetical protein